MENKHPRYINILTIKILDFEFSFKLGNLLWFIEEFKILRRDKNG